MDTLVYTRRREHIDFFSGRQNIRIVLTSIVHTLLLPWCTGRSLSRGVGWEALIWFLIGRYRLGVLSCLFIIKASVFLHRQFVSCVHWSGLCGCFIISALLGFFWFFF